MPQMPRLPRPLRVLVVDDSHVAQLLLAHILESDPQIRVMGMVGDGEAAVAFVEAHRPDVVLMDIHMPGLDGFDTTRRIMETQPLPIVVCSGVANVEEAATVFRALEAGAVACVRKPVGREHPEYRRLANHIRQTVQAMAEVKVVRRWPRGRFASPAAGRVLPEVGLPEKVPSTPGAIRIVGIGASTGGPVALQEVLKNLPRAFPVPILIVQHIAAGFLGGLAEWLRETTGVTVHIATHGVSPRPGYAYLAPDDLHMGLTVGGRIALAHTEPEEHLRPSVSFLFRSLANVYGADVIAVLLTGMGQDGAKELKLLRDRGAVTIAQDAESAVVNGMPGHAVKLGGASYVLPPDRIADLIVTVVASRHPAVSKDR